MPEKVPKQAKKGSRDRKRRRRERERDREKELCSSGAVHANRSLF